MTGRSSPSKLGQLPWAMLQRALINASCRKAHPAGTGKRGYRDASTEQVRDNATACIPVHTAKPDLSCHISTAP